VKKNMLPSWMDTPQWNTFPKNWGLRSFIYKGWWWIPATRKAFIWANKNINNNKPQIWEWFIPAIYGDDWGMVSMALFKVMLSLGFFPR
jgi:hypothetical protein